MSKKYNKMKKIVQLTDLHVPYHDEKSLAGVYDLLDNIRPHQIVITGDMYDFYKLSKFSKDPLNDNSLKYELDEGYKILKILKSLCDDIHFIEGNHEIRLKKYIWEEAPALAGLDCLNFAELTGLNKLDIKHHEEKYIYKSMRFHHGKYASGNSAKKELDNYGLSTTQGHTHRIEMAMKTDGRGMIGSWNMGCLCKCEDVEYIKGIADWQQGFGMFYFDDDRFYCQQIPIIKHKFIFGNKLYGGE